MKALKIPEEEGQDRRTPELAEAGNIFKRRPEPKDAIMTSCKVCWNPTFTSFSHGHRR